MSEIKETSSDGSIVSVNKGADDAPVIETQLSLLRDIRNLLQQMVSK